jgi:hypothetical protein
MRKNLDYFVLYDLKMSEDTKTKTIAKKLLKFLQFFFDFDQENYTQMKSIRPFNNE